MKVNSRMGDLFRVSTEVFLITTVVGLAQISQIKNKNAEQVTHLSKNEEQSRIPQPGSGGAAVINLDAVAENIEVDGQAVPLAQFLQSGKQPERVILRLKGVQWKELATLVRSRDLHFAVETDP